MNPKSGSHNPMCGICGFNWRDESLVMSMANAMVHRGPDQHGTYCSDYVSLGHRRLSIIDLSERGRQPMTNEDGTIFLVFNGEIYNFRDLRKSLVSKGHIFTSDADSEVIVHAYEEYGVNVMSHLHGMFAFAIWDSRVHSILLVRDRVGIKPLYYHFANGKLIFSSEIKSILECQIVPRELNRQALYDYIGFEFVPAPETFFKGIHKIPAGHFLLLDSDGSLNLQQYWDLNLKPPPQQLSYLDAIEFQKELLNHAVKSHLISDVPLGVFLSGGLDSSALVAIMRKHISGPLKTFTIGYHDKTFSELNYAQQVARQFETEHYELIIDDINQETAEKALWHLDEPMTDLSAVPLMLVCQQAKKHVTVCLSGEGGDESYAGYDRFKASKLNNVYRLIPETLRKHVVTPLATLLPDQPQKKGAFNMLKRFIEGANLPEEGAHLRWQYFTNNKQDELLFNDSFRSSIELNGFRNLRKLALKCNAEDRVNREIYLDMRFMMPDSVLMKVDKMGMASALEIRVPLLDHVLVEFIASLPGSWKLKGLRTKHVLRSALVGALPNNIVTRGKQGYSLPIKQILRKQLRGYMTNLLNESPLIKENMNVGFVNRLIREHLDLSHNHNHVLWALMNAAMWHNRFLEK